MRGVDEAATLYPVAYLINVIELAVDADPWTTPCEHGVVGLLDTSSNILDTNTAWMYTITAVLHHPSH